ncbi:hypothetical protein [Streptomyces sp. NBC_00687]|uniref:hypothetical protein n=1 Tax=Streptomyces sp. NBC_00687 TaxID=2975807 RepID=UPI002252860E|nr:hypothetical protein [Streptomyces sp. NBC_00687]MCX4919922.1 hypothetical protein [Streptomyces sp. NBC_00687]
MPARLTTACAAARRTAADIRAIGLRRRRHLNAFPSFLCGPCKTAWTGAEADCFSCGLPATQEHSHPGSALQVLLIAVGRTPALKSPRTEGTQ